MKPLFWVAWIIDLIVAGGFGYFFLLGLSDHTVSSYNIVLWLAILGALGVVVGGSFALHAFGKRILAVCMASALAIAAIFVGFFFLLLIILNPRWN